MITNTGKSNSLIKQYTLMGLKLLLLFSTPVFYLQEGFAQEIPSQFKRPIVYISIKNDKGKYVPSGTAFFVGVRHKYDSTRSYTYLVTARHVLTSYNKATSDIIEIRVNTNEGGSQSEDLVLSYNGKNKNVFFNPDPSVDIAVIPLYLNQAKYSYVQNPIALINRIRF